MCRHARHTVDALLGNTPINRLKTTIRRDNTIGQSISHPVDNNYLSKEHSLLKVLEKNTNLLRIHNTSDVAKKLRDAPCEIVVIGGQVLRTKALSVIFLDKLILANLCHNF